MYHTAMYAINFFCSRHEYHGEAIQRLCKLCLFLLASLATAYACAHDIWLVPDRFVLAKGDTLTVRQMIGPELESGTMDGAGTQELPLYRRITDRLELVTAAGSVNLLKELPDEETLPVVKPILQRRMDAGGLALVTMEHAFIHDQHSREKFLEYLAHEGYPLADHEHGHGHEQHKHSQQDQGHSPHQGHPEHETIDFQAHMGSRPNQRERYRRYLKTLVQVGTPGIDDLHRRRLGQELEIVLLQNPYRLAPGATLEVQILFQDKPLSDALVKAYNRDAEGVVIKAKARTDAQGIARFKLDHKGFWLFRLVHLQPCRGECRFADWESNWASYSFGLE